MRWLLLVACAASLVQPSPARRPPPLSADALVLKLLQVRHPTNFRIHATLTATAGKRSTVRQLLIEGHREYGRASIAYLQLWPERERRAVVIRDAGEHHVRGFDYRGGATAPLTPSTADRAFFDSDFTIEDLAESYWHWPSRTTVAEEDVGENHCVIVDLKPGPSDRTAYSRIRAWIAPDRAVAVRAQFFAPNGRLVKTVSLYRLLKVKDRWMPGIVTMEQSNGSSRSVIEGVKYEGDIRITPAEFTVEGVRRALETAK